MKINNKPNILIVTSTITESQKIDFRHYDYLIAGVGNVAATFHLTRQLLKKKYDFLIFVGIAGGFDIENYPIGSVLEVVNEHFADMGIEKIEQEKYQLTTLFEENIVEQQTYPFVEGKLSNHLPMTDLDKINGVTVNSITTYTPKIDYYQKKYNAVVETLENGSYFYVAQQFKINFCSIRSISNKVGERNKAFWNIPEALYNLNNALQALLNKIETLS